MTARGFAARFAGPIAWRSLAVLAAALAVAALLAMPVRLPVGEPPAAPPAAADAKMPAPAPPVPSYPAIAAYPLFSPTRAPYVPPPAAAPAAAASAPLQGYRLLGTVIEGASQMALLEPPGGRKTIRAALGETIAGWKLRAITPDAVEFENGALRFALHFSHPRWPHP